MVNMRKNEMISSRRIGRFRVSTWCLSGVRRARHDYDAERPYELLRTCIQYSKYDWRSGGFVRQQIWCDPDELRALAGLLEQPADEEQASSAGDPGATVPGIRSAG